ncbi:hypothetical protein AB6E04_03410 [Vibrio amylolyticus]|uniref:hypothetical protein n=1 Tax=Vibrio amylolyticus TaxID=2847292 RepID=UPI00354CDD45
MQVVKELADTLAEHTRSGIIAGPDSTKVSNQTSAITGHGSGSIGLKERLEPTTLYTVKVRNI